MRRFLIGAIIAGVGAALSPPAAAQPARIPLDVGWTIQSSAATDARGDAISQPGFRTDRWRPATVPGTESLGRVDCWTNGRRTPPRKMAWGGGKHASGPKDLPPARLPTSAAYSACPGGLP